MAIKTTSYDQAIMTTFRRLMRGNLSRISERYLSRFPISRKVYGLFKGFGQLLNPKFEHHLAPQSSSKIEHLYSAPNYVDTIKQESVAFGINLSPSMVEEIYNFACSAPCIAYGGASQAGQFTYSELNNGLLRGQYTVALAEVQNLLECKAIQSLVNDPLLLEVVHQYFGYWPTRIIPYMSWTMKMDLPEEKMAKLNQPTVYHYDLAGYSTVRAYFYITDVDETAGPHVMVKGSHERKPLTMLLSPCQQTSSALYQYYGKDSEIVIVGKRGFGFFQDPFCFHRATTPKTQDRLLLQLRYF
ncbi:MAG: hypothetical protein QNJ37_02875 [Crocosphaera sp.]|nr:hypothetical protein [Crocosphaera sp.]